MNVIQTESWAHKLLVFIVLPIYSSMEKWLYIDVPKFVKHITLDNVIILCKLFNYLFKGNVLDWYVMLFTFYLQGKNSNYVTTCLCEKRKVIIFLKVVMIILVWRKTKIKILLMLTELLSVFR